ncbi:hypothetical protein D3C75_825630 [compost metagenome]
MISFAQRFLASQQSGEGNGKVRVVGQHPQGGAVPGHNDFLAETHPLQNAPLELPAVEGRRELVDPVGMGGAHHRHRKAVLRMLPEQDFLTGDLVTRVVPERIG